MRYVYDVLYLVAALLIGVPYALLRRWRRGPGSLSLGERLGAVPSRPVSADCVWIHGVSLGEINATRTLVAELHRHAPDCAIVVSSTTNTGLERARELYPRLTVFRFPLDFSPALNRAMERLRPSILVLMELEIWPNLGEVAHDRKIPVIIANGRVTSDRSMRWFRLPGLRQLAHRMFARIRWVGAQDQTYAARFRELGVPHESVVVCGSLKFDAADASERIEGQEALADAMTIDRRKPLLVCGSTGDEEELLILAAYERLLEFAPELQLAIIPRKPERFDDVARLIAQCGFTCLRRSGKPPLVPPEVAAPRAVFLGDTTGELRKFYALATINFVGRSLVPMGGSDMIEAAALGKPLLIGPHTDNFAEAVAVLKAAGACEIVADAGELASACRNLICDAERGKAMGAAAREVVLGGRGATQKTVEAILRIGRIGID